LLREFVQRHGGVNRENLWPCRLTDYNSFNTVIHKPEMQAAAIFLGLFRDEVFAKPGEAPRRCIAAYFQTRDVHRPETAGEFSANRTVGANGLPLDQDVVSPNRAGEPFGIEREQGTAAGANRVDAGGTPRRVHMKLVHGPSQPRERLFDLIPVDVGHTFERLIGSRHVRGGGGGSVRQYARFWGSGAAPTFGVQFQEIGSGQSSFVPSVYRDSVPLAVAV
jgi:hypothetical protein